MKYLIIFYSTVCFLSIFFNIINNKNYNNGFNIFNLDSMLNQPNKENNFFNSDEVLNKVLFFLFFLFLFTIVIFLK